MPAVVVASPGHRQSWASGYCRLRRRERRCFRRRCHRRIRRRECYTRHRSVVFGATRSPTRLLPPNLVTYSAAYLDEFKVIL